MLFIEDAFPLLVIVGARRFDEAETRSMADGFQRYFVRGQRYAVLSASPRDAELPGATARKMVTDWLRRDDVQKSTRALCVGAASVNENAVTRGALTALMWVWTPPMPVRPVRSIDEGLDYCLSRLEAAALALPRPADEVRRATLARLQKVL